jgi:hypothetical protein
VTRVRAGRRPDGADDRGAYWRLALWCLLIVGWLVMLPQLWAAFATVPSAERLEQARLVPIPTLQTVALLVARSASEMAVVLGLLWPWRARHYLVRILGAAALLAAWFVLTTPLSLSAVAWVHRRWLAAMTGGLLLAFVGAAAARLAGMIAGRVRGAL